MRRILVAQKTSRISHGVAVSALFSAISLLYGSAAYGGFYPGHIDPGGNGFDIPGFTGDAIFSIPNTCIGGTGWVNTNANGGSGCGNASVYSATISLYSTALDDPPNPGTVLDSFTFGTSAPGALPLSTFDILGVYSLNGVLAGIDTDPMGPINGSSTYLTDQFWLQFVSGFCQFGCTPVPPMQPPPGDPAYLFVNSLDNPSFPGTVIFGSECRTDPNGAPVDCVVTTPEPGTLALLFGALGGGWLARRRKAKLKA
jgi:hypothetical protein